MHTITISNEFGSTTKTFDHIPTQSELTDMADELEFSAGYAEARMPQDDIIWLA